MSLFPVSLILLCRSCRSRSLLSLLSWITFREHNKEADARAEKGARGPEEEWEADVEFAEPAVTGISGFCDGSCHVGF